MAKKATIDDLKAHLDSINPSLFEMLNKPKERFSFRVNLLKSNPKESIKREVV